MLNLFKYLVLVGWWIIAADVVYSFDKFILNKPESYDHCLLITLGAWGNLDDG